MTAGKTSVLTPFFRALLTWPLAIGLVLAVMTALALWQSTRIQVAVNLGGLIGAETEGARAIRAYERQFGGFQAEEVLFVTTDAAQGFGDEEALSVLENLVFELQFAEGVRNVISILALPAPGRQGPWLTGPELAHLSMAERLRRMRAEHPLAAQLVSQDMGAAAVVAVFDDGQRAEHITRTLAEVAATAQGIEVAPVGLITVQDEIAKALVQDLTLLTPTALGLCIVLSIFLFRSVRAVVVIAVPPVTGLIWFFGWLGFSGTQIDPIMGAMPIVLLVLAFSDSIHVYHAALHRIGGAGDALDGEDRRRALVQAMVETAPAAALTSLTTIIAFASMSLPDSPSLNTMALAGSVGMALALLAVVLLTPLIMWALAVPRPNARPPALFERLTKPALWVAGHVRPVALFACLGLVVLIAVQSQGQLGFRYFDYLPRGAAVSQSLEAMEARGLGSDRMIVVVEADPDAPLANVRRAVAAIWGEDRATWAEGDAGAAMLARMGSADGTAHALPVQLPIVARDIRANTELLRLETRLSAAGLSQVTHVVGPGQALLSEGPRLVTSLRTGLYATIIAVTALVLVIYRSVWLGIAALMVNLLPILGVEAWLVVTGHELTVMNMIALTIAFGIAVDDTLHFLNRLRLAKARHPGPAATDLCVAQALREAAPPIVATTVILLAGLLLTLASDLPGLSLYGSLIGLAVALALLADLFLLPGLIKWRLITWEPFARKQS